MSNSQRQKHNQGIVDRIKGLPAQTAASETDQSSNPAAQVGEQDTATEWINRVKFFEMADKHLKNATIERCLQIVKKFGQYSNSEWIDLNIEKIYFEISKLKDE